VYIQRKVDPKLYRKRKGAPHWTPRVLKKGIQTAAVQEGIQNWYAVVDEIADDTVRMEITKWPTLDTAGRLRFSTLSEQSYSLEKLQHAVNKARSQHNQAAPDRPLRVGDAFCIQSPTKPKKDMLSLHFRGAILDITEEAREQAKIALYAAVAQRLEPSDPQTLLESSKPSSSFLRKSQDQKMHRRLQIPGATAKPEV